MPAIVLLNPGAEGSLLTPRTPEEELDAEYWKERAVYYRMGQFKEKD